jgi:3-oxoacyl-(acyl-carrier-protein) synthase
LFHLDIFEGMKKHVYVTGLSCISAQPTFGAGLDTEWTFQPENNVLETVHPVYKSFLPAAALRRMSKVIRMGVTSANAALADAGVSIPDAIILGTGMGCGEDSDKFLEAIVGNGEEMLTPTAFIQSTHNTVGAQVAVGIGCKGYNLTYVNGAVSFESALLDAHLTIAEGNAHTILTGGIDELTKHSADLFRHAGLIKTGGDYAEVLQSKSAGTVFGEGAAFAVLSDNPRTRPYAEVADVWIAAVLEPQDVAGAVSDFLTANGLTAADIDAVMLGIDGDVRYDAYYSQLATDLFAETPQVYYKHLCGEFNTAQAFGFWAACHLLHTNGIPQVMAINHLPKRDLHHILLYNQYNGIDHSLILLKACRNTP